LCFAVEITCGKVVARTKLTSPACTQGVKDKVATIEVTMHLVLRECLGSGLPFIAMYKVFISAQELPIDAH